MDHYQNFFKHLASQYSTETSGRNLTRYTNQFKFKLESFMLFCCHAILPSQFEVQHCGGNFEVASHVKDVTKTVESTNFEDSSIQELTILFANFCHVYGSYLDTATMISVYQILAKYKNCSCSKCKPDLMIRVKHGAGRKVRPCIYKSKSDQSLEILISD